MNADLAGRGWTPIANPAALAFMGSGLTFVATERQQD